MLKGSLLRYIQKRNKETQEKKQVYMEAFRAAEVVALQEKAVRDANAKYSSSGSGSTLKRIAIGLSRSAELMARDMTGLSSSKKETTTQAQPHEKRRKVVIYG